MDDQPSPQESPPDPSAGNLANPAPTPASGNPPKTGGPATPAELTPEEQMERFAKELKETDWGHQPC